MVKTSVAKCWLTVTPNDEPSTSVSVWHASRLHRAFDNGRASRLLLQGLPGVRSLSAHPRRRRRGWRHRGGSLASETFALHRWSGGTCLHVAPRAWASALVCELLQH